MAEPDSKDLAATLTSGGATPVLALVLILATTVGVLNLPSGSRDESSTTETNKQAEAPRPSSGPAAKAGVADALEALEPLQRFLDLESTPATLEELAGRLSGYRVTTLIASLSDPKESRLGYDFDMALEAIQRAIESEGYTLDRSRFPWLEAATGPAPAGAAATAPAAANAPGSAPAASFLRGQRHERQPGVILFRIDRPAPQAGAAGPVQDLLLLLLVGETPTWGIQQEALMTSLDIAWALEGKRKLNDSQGEPVIRLLGPTFSGTGDSLARVLRTWSATRPERSDARIWVCTGAATAVDKKSFQRNALPAQVVYAATVIPDEILLGELYRFLARPASSPDSAAAPLLPEGKIGLLVEGGSGYGSAVGNAYGTSGTSIQSRRIVSIPFPSQISQMRSTTAAGPEPNKKGRNRVTIPFDPPSGKQSDGLPALSPRMTVATDNLIVSNILATISREEIRYVGIVATDILDVIYLVRLIRENCPDVQVILVGNDLRYTDPQFTLDFRGTVIASSYPLDARAQVWSYPFQGAIERRLFASEFDIGRYNAALVLINGRRDPDHSDRLVIDAGSAEDFLVYGKPFVGSFFDSVNRRPQIWINQVGQLNVWPLKVMPLSQSELSLRITAEALIPPVVSLDPHAEAARDLSFDYDLPLIWKLAFCIATFLAILLAGVVLYTNLGKAAAAGSRSSWFDPLLRRFAVSTPDLSRKNLFLIAMLVLALAVPYCTLAAPLDLAVPAGKTSDGEQIITLKVDWDVYALAGLAVVTLVWLLVPLIVCLREVVRPSGSDPALAGNRLGDRGRNDRWLSAEDLLYRMLTALAVGAGIACILFRLYQFATVRPAMPNGWLALDRSAHLLGGISPIVPVACLGAAIFWWSFLELKRLQCCPLLRRGADLIPLPGHALPRDFPWKRVIGRLNARYRLCVDLLEYPVTVLISRNLPLAGVVLSAVAGLVVFVWGVVWPRFVPTPEGFRFDLLIVLALLSYLLLLLHSQLRYLWLWRSLLQLFRQISLLPMAGAFDRTPPRVAARFGRFLRTSLDEDIDLEIPLHQCRLVLGLQPDSGQENVPVRQVVRQTVASCSMASEQERFEAVSKACIVPVIELAWPSRSLHEAYSGADLEKSKNASDDPQSPAENTVDPATREWLRKAEDLLALRIVYLLSQLAGPLRCMSAQLIYGPILLLLAVAWYPFHPQRLMAIMIWSFISLGVLMTLALLIQVERTDFVSRAARIAPGTVKLDHTLISNLLPYVVPVVGFVFTAFPSLSYWLGSLLEPIGRAVK
jgi:hypothetical protein